MPANCSADVVAAISKIDQVLTSGHTGKIDAIKATFGLQDLANLDDFAAACESLINTTHQGGS